MAGHPIRFRDDDPLLIRLREICLDLPDAEEKISHGRPQWFTTRIFAGFGASVRGAHQDPLLDRALLFLPEPAEREALDRDPRLHVPAYVGHRGWRALPLDRDDTDWTEVAELVESSYRGLAGARRVSRLDARDADPR